MPIQVDQTEIFCSFCARTNHTVPLMRSMHGLYCANEHCYTRVTDGNLVPSMPCAECKENSFYTEEGNDSENAGYICIACGALMPI